MYKKDVLMEEQSLEKLFEKIMEEIIQEIGSSPVIKKLTRKMKGILREVENSAYAEDIKKIITDDGFRVLFRKQQIYEGGYRFNSRGIHTLKVCTRSVALARRLIERGIPLDLSLVVAIALSHDLGHFAFAHVAESEIDKLLQYKWRHGQEGMWYYGFVEKGKFSPIVLDGMLCHSDIEQEMTFDPQKDLDVIQQLSDTKRVPASLETILVKIADKFGNAIDDIKDAGHNGVNIKGIYPLLNKLGREADKIYETLIKGVRVEGNQVIIEKEEFDQFEQMQVFCYGDEKRNIKGKIHHDRRLVEERKVTKEIIFRVLNGLVHFIEKEMYKKEILEDLFVKEFANTYMNYYGEVYKGIKEFSFIKAPVEYIIAIDIFSRMEEPAIHEVEANMIQFAHGDEELHKVRMKKRMEVREG